MQRHPSLNVLDTTRAVETPEGIELGLRVAGLVPRALAWSLDTLIRLVAYAVLWMVVSNFGNFGIGLGFILTFAIEWFYPVIGEVYFSGRTFGKRAMGLRVVNDNGTAVGWSASMVRNLLRFADFMPVLYGFGIVTMLVHSDFKRLGDIVAGTRVVYEDADTERAMLPEAHALAPPISLTPAEQRALIHFAERMPGLTEERALELAELTGPLVAGDRRPDQRLLAYANWAAGVR